ncbi:hypothetical protein ACFSTI_04130 [Rhizorhabdus histidinilytica]
MRPALILIALIVVAALAGPLALDWRYDLIDWDAVRAAPSPPAIRWAPTASAATCWRGRWSAPA